MNDMNMVLPYPQKITIPQTPSSALEDKLVTINSTCVDDTLAYLEESHCSRTIVIIDNEADLHTDRLRQLLVGLELRCVGKQVVVADNDIFEEILAVAQLLSHAQADSSICLGTQRCADIVKVARLLYQNSPPLGLNEEGLKNLAKRYGLHQPPSIKLVHIPRSLSLAEYNPVSRIKDKTGKEYVFGHQESVAMLPDLILLDPEMVLSHAPDHNLLAIGARAIDQACETLCSQSTEDQGLIRVRRGLLALVSGLKTYKEQLDLTLGTTTALHPNKRQKISADCDQLTLLQAISNCQQGIRDITSGVTCYGTNLGSSHAISQAMHAVTGLSLEISSCITLPAVLRYENPGDINGREWRIVNQNFILDTVNEVMGWHEKSASMAIINFFQYLGLPTKLSDAGLPASPMATASHASSASKSGKVERKYVHSLQPDILKQVARKVVEAGDWMSGETHMNRIEVVLGILNSVK